MFLLSREQKKMMQDLASLGEEGECISASTEEDIPFGLLKYIFCSSFFFFFFNSAFSKGVVSDPKLQHSLCAEDVAIFVATDL